MSETTDVARLRRQINALPDPNAGWALLYAFVTGKPPPDPSVADDIWGRLESAGLARQVGTVWRLATPELAVYVKERSRLRAGLTSGSSATSGSSRK